MICSVLLAEIVWIMANQHVDSWSIDSWLRGQSGVAAALTAALLSGEQPADELEFARTQLPLDEAALRDRLLQGGALEKLAAVLAPPLAKLRQGQAATAAQLTEKFVTDGTGFDLKLGDLSTFLRWPRGGDWPAESQRAVGHALRAHRRR